MENYFSLHMQEDDIRAISSIGLAHLGDGVYELLVRAYLCAHGKATGKGLHRSTVELVKAPAQAQLNVDVSSPTWEQLDQMDLTAAQWEGKRLDWEAFDFTGGLEWTAGQEG